MKISVFLPIAILLTVSRLTAQDCAAFFPFEKGATMEYTFYDSKGKLSNVSSQKVVIIDDEGAAGITAQVDVVMTDKNGKEQTKGNYKVICKDNTLSMDVTAMMPQMTQAFSSLEMQISGDQLQLPSKLTAGQTLPDAHMEIKAGSGGINLMKVTIDITERKVEGKESITTALGTYEAYKITYTTNTKTLMSKSFRSTGWYAPKIGLIKQETYDKKGSLDSSMVLTKFSK